MTNDEIRTLNRLLAQTVTPGQIAILAGVTPSTVSNWRRRNVGFPSPVASIDKRELYSLDAVVRWIDAHDYELTNGRQGVTQSTVRHLRVA